MRPTAQDLVEHIVTEMRTDVVPMAQDHPWLASRLRSIVASLTHVAARLDCERPILAASNRALRDVLADCQWLVPDVVPPARGSADAGAPDGTTEATDTGTDRLEAENRELRQRIDGLLRALAGDERTEARRARRLVVATLQADTERERPLYDSFLRMANY
jgi:hypothetical protein